MGENETEVQTGKNILVGNRSDEMGSDHLFNNYFGGRWVQHLEAPQEARLVDVHRELEQQRPPGPELEGAVGGGLRTERNISCNMFCHMFL